MSSDAVGLERKSRITGWKTTKGNFNESTENLPQRIAVFGTVNTANDDTYPEEAKEIITAKQAGEYYGFGSHIYQALRVLRPNSGGGTIGGIPVIVYPQKAPQGATARTLGIEPTGTATANAKHTLIIAGRRGVDGVNYDVNIVKGDTPTTIKGKIYDAINNVLGCPVTAAISSPAGDCTATAKWKGDTTNEIDITVDTNGNDAGISYAISEEEAGSGTPSIAAQLETFGNEWVTIVLNGYGTDEDILDALEAFNGTPDPELPTGRFTGTVMKPFIAVTGSLSDDPTAVTDARKLNCTIAIAPAPLSKGLNIEAAANMIALFARVSQDTPHLDVQGKYYPDMPMPESGDIPAMCNYDTRDSYIKKGCSTVDIVAGKYQVQDFVTTYHPAGEIPAQFAYCRNLMLDSNIRYGYYLLELIHVVDHVIAEDNATVSATKVVKPKMWKQVLFSYAENLATRALVADAKFMQDSTTVNIGTNNPDRLETFFKYQRTGCVRIASTTAEAGFNFGKVAA